MAAADVGPVSIGQIAVRVRELERAKAFYRDRLGLRFLFEVPKMSFFDCGGVRLMLAESHLTRRLFGSMVRRIAALPVPAG